MPKLTVFFKGLALSVQHIQDENEIILGRDPDCDLQIDSLAVAPHHASIRRNGERYRIFALDEKVPLAVNGKTIREQELSHGDLIQVGKHTLEFAADEARLEREPTPAPSQEAAPAEKPERSGEPEPEPTPGDALSQDDGVQANRSRAYLQILSGHHIGRILPLNRAIIRLGKSGGDCAMIAFAGGAHFLSHLEGEMTLLNGKPVGERRARLNDGDVIRMGEVEMAFFAA